MITQKVDPLVTVAIKAKADEEALVEWAKRVSEPLPIFESLPRLRFTETAANVFGKQTFKKTLSILLP